jgi:uncharacterized protein YdeI (YjbR/CyaY-like superfamily)
MPPDHRPIKFFSSPALFRRWLNRNHATSDGIWIRFYKKDSGKKTMVYAEALDESLCYGWIDGLVNRFDADSYIQRYTPRRPKSGWSKRNTEHVRRLIAEGRMKPSGMAQVEAAKKDGRWKAAYSSPRNAKPPADFLQALDQDKAAKAFFSKLNRANVYAIVYRLETSRTAETRKRWIERIVTMLREEKKFY